jgi:hypothetical protein
MSDSLKINDILRYSQCSHLQCPLNKLGYIRLQFYSGHHFIHKPPMDSPASTIQVQVQVQLALYNFCCRARPLPTLLGINSVPKRGFPLVKEHRIKPLTQIFLNMLQHPVISSDSPYCSLFRYIIYFITRSQFKLYVPI